MHPTELEVCASGSPAAALVEVELFEAARIEEGVDCVDGRRTTLHVSAVKRLMVPLKRDLVHGWATVVLVVEGGRAAESAKYVAALDRVLHTDNHSPAFR